MFLKISSGSATLLKRDPNHSHKKRKDKTGRTGRFFFKNWVPKTFRTQSTQACINYKHSGRLQQFKVKGLNTCFMANLRMPGQNCSIFNYYSSRAVPGISFFRKPINKEWRQNLTKGTTFLQLLLVCRQRFEKAN